MTSMCMTRPLLLTLLMVSLAGCTDLQRRLQYDNLDQVARDATGKELWEIEEGLSKEQGQQRAANIKLLLQRALIPAIELREMETNRQLLRSGCNHRR